MSLKVIILHNYSENFVHFVYIKSYYSLTKLRVILKKEVKLVITYNNFRKVYLWWIFNVSTWINKCMESGRDWLGFVGVS